MARFNHGSKQLGDSIGLGGLLGLFAAPFYLMYWIFKYGALLMWWMMKGMFWLFFWPIKLFKH